MMPMKHWILWSAVALVAPSALAQDASGMDQPASSQGAVMKGRAPVNNEVLRIEFPRPRETRLSNGVTVMVLEDHFLPKVSIRVIVPSGSLDDPEDMPGLASFTADLLSEGAGELSSLDVANMLDAMGAIFSAVADFGENETVIRLSGLAEHADKMVSLLADLVLRPTFPEDELEKYRARELAALSQLRTRPRFLAKERFMAALYSVPPLTVVAPSNSALQSVTTQDLESFHARHYLPEGSLIAVTGDLRMEDIVSSLEDAFGSWEPGEPSDLALPAIAASQQLRICLVHRPNSVQTTLMLGNIGIARTDPDYVYTHVLNQVLGANASSRLFLELREAKGYTYGAYSKFETASYPRPWNAHADVRTDVTRGALTDFLAELQDLIDNPVPNEELENAKRAIVARFALSLERSRVLTTRAIELKKYGLPADYWDKYPEMVRAVTAEDVQRVAAKYLDPGRLQIVAVGDADAIRGLLESFGPVKVFSVDGTPME